MRISVVIPTYNSSEFIERALNSVFSQSELPNEIIISDDGSVDSTVKKVRDIIKTNHLEKICKIILNSHSGPGAARNKGILAASKDWITFLDSDDFWHVDKIKEVKKHCSGDSKINFICHNEIRTNYRGKNFFSKYNIRHDSNKSLFDQLYERNMISTSTVICKKKIFLNYGLFNENLMSAQDYELWLRIADYINLEFLEGYYGYYVERKGNITSGNKFKRIKNDFYISYLYSNKVSTYKYIQRLIRILASYILQIIKKNILRL